MHISVRHFLEEALEPKADEVVLMYRKGSRTLFLVSLFFSEVLLILMVNITAFPNHFISPHLIFKAFEETKRQEIQRANHQCVTEAGAAWWKCK